MSYSSKSQPPGHSSGKWPRFSRFGAVGARARLGCDCGPKLSKLGSKLIQLTGFEVFLKHFKVSIGGGGLIAGVATYVPLASMTLPALNIFAKRRCYIFSVLP